MAFCCAATASSNFCTSVSSFELSVPLDEPLCANIRLDTSITKITLFATRIELVLLSIVLSMPRLICEQNFPSLMTVCNHTAPQADARTHTGLAEPKQKG